MYIPFNKEKGTVGDEVFNILPEYISDFNFTRKIQVVLLKISDGKKWHFLAALKDEKEEDSDFIRPAKCFSRLMRDILSDSHENYYCFECFHLFRCKSTLENHTQLCKDNTFCKVNLPIQGENIKEHKFGSKTLTIKDIMYVDLECILVNYNTCSNNLNKSHTNNVAKHIPWGYAINILRNHDSSSKVSYYRGKDCVKKLCKELSDIGMALFNTEKKPMILSTPEQKKHHNEAIICFICQRKFCTNKKSSFYMNFKKVEDHDHYTGMYRGAAHSLCNFKYTTQWDIPVVIHNGSKYDFHLMINELADEFREEIHYIPEDKEKFKSFSVTIMHDYVSEYEVPYNLRFIDSNKFMMRSLDTHVINLSELQSCNCSDKSKQHIRINYDDNIYTRCKSCTKRSKQSIQSLIEKFPNTYQLTNGDIKKFILLLKKGVYPYEYMNNYDKFNDTELSAIDKFYSNLNLKNISKEDYKHAQNVWSAFNIKNMGDYHDLYVQSDTTQLADIFEQFRNLCLKEYKLDPAYFCTTPGLALEACLKMTKVKLELLTDIAMVLMFEKQIRGGISQAIQKYSSDNNKYMPNVDPDHIS